MMWWAMFLCLSGTYDYTGHIAMAAGGRYCPEIVDYGMAVVIDTQNSTTPPMTFEEIMGWNPDPWMNFYIVTTKNRTDADSGAECGSTSRYWVACYDRWMEYDSGRTECIHDCVVLGLYREGEAL